MLMQFVSAREGLIGNELIGPQIQCVEEEWPNTSMIDDLEDDGVHEVYMSLNLSMRNIQPSFAWWPFWQCVSQKSVQLMHACWTTCKL